MTPEEHYEAAVRLLAEARATPSNNDETNPAAALLLAEAQVHATLATYTPPTVEIVTQIADWLDAHGDTWREVGDGRMRLVAQKNGACFSLGMNGPRENIEKCWGPLVPSSRPVTV